MTDLLLKMDSNILLLLYLLICILITGLTKYFYEKDATINMEVPEPSSISAVDTALLTKGVKGAIITCIFSLWSKKLIDISKRGKSTYIRKLTKKTETLNPLEMAIIAYLKTPKLYRHFFNENAILKLESILHTDILRLQELKLLTGRKTSGKKRLLFVLAMLFMVLSGFMLIYFDIAHDKSFIFQFILMLLVVLVLIYTIRPAQLHTTSLGKKFIRQSSQRFEWLKSELNTTNLMADTNLAYLVALFGASAIMGSISSDYHSKEIATTLDYGCGGGGLNGENCSNAGGCAGGGCSGHQEETK